jgi:hypothetical protein
MLLEYRYQYFASNSHKWCVSTSILSQDTSILLIDSAIACGEELAGGQASPRQTVE